MSLSSRKEYLARIYERYHRVGRKFKSQIVREFGQVCGYNHKYALRLLNRKPAQGPRRRPGPKPKYDSAHLLAPLKQIWLCANQPCALRLKAVLPLWLPFLPDVSPAVQKQLLAASRCTLDRLLKPVRLQHPRRGLATTKPGRLLRHQIPLRDGPPNTKEVGHVEADTVAHCGDSTAGDFIYSLTFTDLYSGWTEIRATWNKSALGILAQLKDIEQGLPFTIKSFHADNGSEFLNWPLWDYLRGRKRKVKFTRSRAYRKNDNAHVEQKNWTHVRELFGHERFERPELVKLMNDLYSREWSLLQNHFSPSVKLKSKEKRGSKYRRVYEEPQTPYQRLMQSGQLSPQARHQLKQIHRSLNPFDLRKTIAQKIKTFLTAFGYLQCESTFT